MNTPLGVQGLKHQQERDKHEAAFRERYGFHTASTEAGKSRAYKAVGQAMKELERVKVAASKVNSIFKASGRNPCYA